MKSKWSEYEDESNWREYQQSLDGLHEYLANTIHQFDSIKKTPLCVEANGNFLFVRVHWEEM